jgi:hypothetical protein
MMRKTFLAVVFTVAVAVTALAGLGVGYIQQQGFQPSVGQPGKDVIWVPTPAELIEALYDLAKVNSSDYLVDLGSGDGPWVIAAAKRGARALGVEFNPDMVEFARSKAKLAGVADKANFVQGDIFEADFTQATVITMYLLPDLNMKLRPKILEMKPGTRVLTNAFTMEDWEPDQHVTTADGRSGYMWIVPAKVAGTWSWQTPAGPAELTLQQTFQKITGTLRIGGKALSLKDAQLQGAKISFTAGDTAAAAMSYAGSVSGNAIIGTSKAGAAETKWTAERRIIR